MAEWAPPLFNRGRVDAAGDTYAKALREPLSVDAGELGEALEVIGNWRSSHSYPLQALKMTLLGRAARAMKGHAVVLQHNRPVIAQRLKRLVSIGSKLLRNEHMKLSQMQDIGGCRAVMMTVPYVDSIVRVYADSRAKNPNDRSEFVKVYDYVSSPKPDGYRGVHLVYKYRSGSKSHSIYNGHRIEIQLRSRHQHTWATAVEMAETFTGQALKTNVGRIDAAWRRFFALMATVFAIRERRPLVPGTPSNQPELFGEIRDLSRKLRIETVFAGWNEAVQIVEGRSPAGAKQFLLQLDPTAGTVHVSAYSQSELERASRDYLRAEKEMAARADAQPHQVVLVSVQSLAGLRKAYPNYYLDTRTFLYQVRKVTKFDAI